MRSILPFAFMLALAPAAAGAAPDGGLDAGAEAANTAAPPTAAPQTPKDAIKAGTDALTAFRSGEWLLGIALAVMVLVFVLKRFVFKALPGSWLPWLSVGVAVAGAVADAILSGIESGNLSWLSVGSTGLLAGLAAVGVWEAGGKKVAGSATARERASAGGG